MGDYSGDDSDSASSMEDDGHAQDARECANVLLKMLRMEDLLGPGEDDYGICGDTRVKPVLDKVFKRLQTLETKMKEHESLLMSHDEKEETLGLDDLLYPGNEFVGTIRIPHNLAEDDPQGNVFGQRVPYKLTIVRYFDDEFGDKQLMVRHSAHSDEQACIFVVNRNGEDEDEVEISFSDFETICTGKLSIRERRIYGTVHQLLDGDEGYEVKGKDQVHTFDVQLASPTSPSYRELKLNFITTRRKFALLLSMYMIDMNAGSQSFYMIDYMRKDEPLRDLLMLLSEVCAMLLRHTKVVKSITFDTEEAKKSIIQDLKERGIQRANPKIWDAVMKFSLSLMFPTLEYVRLAGPVEQHRVYFQLHSKTQTLQQRTNICYTRLGQAFREMEMRIPTQIITAWVCNQAMVTEHDVCCICLSNAKDPVEVEGGDKQNKTLQLPCGHIFHFSCATTWFRTSQVCPHCRRKCI